MIMTKKKKIRKDLDSIPKDNWTAFDELLNDWLSDELKRRLVGFGITKTEFHIDYLDSYKCIEIQGKYAQYYVDIQIEKEKFFIACDPDEADETEWCPLESAEQFYETVSNTLLNRDPL